MSLTKIIGNIWDGGIFDNKFIPEYKCLVFFFCPFLKGVYKFHINVVINIWSITDCIS